MSEWFSQLTQQCLGHVKISLKGSAKLSHFSIVFSEGAEPSCVKDYSFL